MNIQEAFTKIKGTNDFAYLSDATSHCFAFSIQYSLLIVYADFNENGNWIRYEQNYEFSVTEILSNDWSIASSLSDITYNAKGS